MAKIFLIDFDGVIHSYKSGWKGIDVIPDPPMLNEANGESSIIWLKRLIFNWMLAIDAEAERYAVRPMIYSSRSKDPKGVKAMKNWLLEHGLTKNFLIHLEFPTEKPAAFLTLDDRAICFKGTFPSIEEVSNFKPYKQKD